MIVDGHTRSLLADDKILAILDTANVTVVTSLKQRMPLLCIPYNQYFEYF